MVYYRVHSRAQRHRVAVEGLYNGASAFLVGANPKLLELDLRLMNLPGVYSMAINNAAAVFEPSSFIALDQPRCFDFNILTNPRIMKFMSNHHSDLCVEGQRVCRFPNILFYDEGEVTHEEFCQKEGDLPSWRNTFFAALCCLYQLGFSEVYLVGCTFDIDQQKPYAYKHDLSDNLIEYNRRTYDQAVDILKALAPKVSDSGMEILTCHEGSSLDGIIDYVPFPDAVGRAVRKAAPIRHNELYHSSE